MRPASAQHIAQLSDLMFAAAANKLKQLINCSSATIGLRDTRATRSHLLAKTGTGQKSHLVALPARLVEPEDRP